jgi:Arc/MetJ-type ribon-helix-helix transcriptional regulator
MTIEIQQPELEALIQQRMASGRFGSVEEVLMAALKLAPEPEERRPAGRKSLAQLFAESPFRGMNMEFPRDPSLSCERLPARS